MKGKVYILLEVNLNTNDSTPRSAVLEDLSFSTLLNENEDIEIQVSSNCGVLISSPKIIEFGDKETLLAELESV
jgi:hypothetical protein